MIVIGIDPGTATTGYGIVEEDNAGELRALDYGIVSTKPDLTLENRLKIIFDQINDFILLHQPDNAAVEKLYFKKNVTNAIAVGQARGVVLLAFAKNGIPIFEYSPSEVKSAISGYGGADKTQVQAMVKAILNLNDVPKPDDAADALAIAICHINSSGFVNRSAHG
jgi:crossover junction endodeoxyribonuclease RuvC